MGEHEIAMLLDPHDAALEIINLRDRVDELEALVQRLITLNDLREVER
jgi:hypothetical protein